MNAISGEMSTSLRVTDAFLSKSMSPLFMGRSRRSAARPRRSNP
jgi:hypothetical protein